MNLPLRPSGAAVASADDTRDQANRESVSRWPAALALELQRTARGTRLLSRRHSGPLYVQRPFYPEGPDLAHVYLLHPPGGLVSGDELSFDIALGADAGALLTTPGAARIYRAREDATWQRQRVHLDLEAGSSAEWLPMENIVFPGAEARLDTRVDLAASSRFIGWEISCTGLPASGEQFARGRLRQTFRLYREGRPLLMETLNLDMEDERLYYHRAGLAGCNVSGLMVATLAGEADEDLLDSLRTPGQEQPLHPVLSVTAIDTLLVLRYLGPCTHQARRLFEAAWRCLRPRILGRPASDPRIWRT
ncbi:urease accessory protein UreD [Parahaliea maris]|uniref:Urease accessory protein UreD n=1 Tax=Parahaliea maris TaxID=2716870 RepID=A0A5C9A6W3_9GAMM|nr:urease accessory protein UreD [Parahaliea maris]TXS95722.1 urease accessory protein UreD [Parahaliea maris]